jgi:hypothetical protein
MANTLTRTAALYEEDFVAWLEEQAAHLRAGRLHDLDVENIAEELEGLARSDRRELRNRLEVLLAHMLKRDQRPEKRSRSWEATIDEQRSRIEDLLDDSPSLRREVAGAIAKVYPRARRAAARDARLPLTRFPAAPPYSVDELLPAEDR